MDKFKLDLGLVDWTITSEILPPKFGSTNSISNSNEIETQVHQEACSIGLHFNQITPQNQPTWKNRGNHRM